MNGIGGDLGCVEHGGGGRGGGRHRRGARWRGGIQARRRHVDGGEPENLVIRFGRLGGGLGEVQVGAGRGGVEGCERVARSNQNEERLAHGHHTQKNFPASLS